MLVAGLGRRPLDGEGGTETEHVDKGRMNGTWRGRVKDSLKVLGLET